MVLEVAQGFAGKCQKKASDAGRQAPGSQNSLGMSSGTFRGSACPAVVSSAPSFLGGWEVREGWGGISPLICPKMVIDYIHGIQILSHLVHSYLVFSLKYCSELQFFTTYFCKLTGDNHNYVAPI